MEAGSLEEYFADDFALEKGIVRGDDCVSGFFYRLEESTVIF